MRVAVIGSGPAATATALALTNRGLRPTVIDVGTRLDSDRAALAAELAQRPRSQWTDEELHRISENPTIRASGIPRKLLFGSDFIYALDHPAAPTDAANAKISASFAYGGFGAAWGGAMLPAANCDIADWPVRRADLEPAYRAILRELPLAGANDDLASEFPLYKENPGLLDLPAEAAALLRDVTAANFDEGSRILAGRARIAVRPADDPGGYGCRFCGMCLSGCVYGAIAAPSEILDRLIAAALVEYKSGAVVKTVRQEGESVRVTFRTPGAGLREELVFDRVFIAAGPLGTTRVVLESRSWIGEGFELKDSQKFALPFFRRRRIPLSWPNTNTLAALFIELQLAGLSQHWIHIQVSAVNDYVLGRAGLLEPGRHWRRTAANILLERLMIGWCSLHSDHSSRLLLTLLEDKRGGEHILRVDHRLRPEAGHAMREVSRALRRIGLRFGALFPVSMLQPSLPGAGLHTGGAFPMRAKPRERADTDALGRFAGQDRIHIVDASIFPSVPATTIVLPLMANAYRIAATAPL